MTRNLEKFYKIFESKKGISLVPELFCKIAKSQTECSAHQNTDILYFAFAVYLPKNFAKLQVMQLH